MNQITFKLGEAQVFKSNNGCDDFEVIITLQSLSNEMFTFEVRRAGKKEIIQIQRGETVLMHGKHFQISGYGSDFVTLSLKYTTLF